MIHIEFQAERISLKIKIDITKYVVCCSRDWRIICYEVFYSTKEVEN